MKPIIGWVVGWSVPYIRKHIREDLEIRQTKAAAEKNVTFPYTATRIKITVERIAAGKGAK